MLPYEGGMPSNEANAIIKKSISILREKREQSLMPSPHKEGESKSMSVWYLGQQEGLDPAGISRAENGTRIPSIGFFLDWAKALGTTMEDVIQEARELLEQDSTPPE